MRWLWMMLTLGVICTILGLPEAGRADEGHDAVIYSVYKALDLGNPGETPQKDFYVNIGSSQGVRTGTLLTVVRRMSTYDLLSEKLYKDVSFPIARLKVIHSESNAAIARLEKMLPPDKTPAVTPFAVMIGDSVRISE